MDPDQVLPTVALPDGGSRNVWRPWGHLATFTAALLVWEFRVLVLLILALVIAATVRPLVDWFAARRLPRGLALCSPTLSLSALSLPW
jgi:predicted PurR-regulated permease PerM